MPDIFPLFLTKFKSRRPLACALLALLISLPLGAQSRYWDTNGAGFGASDQFGSAPGVWDAATTANWSTDSSGNQPSGFWVAGATANFVAGDFHNGTYTVTVDGTVDVAAINFHNGDLTLDGGVLANLALVSVSVSRAAFINSAISGTQAFTKNGDGRLTLSGANSYTGSTLLQGGRLTFANQGAFYSGVIDATTAGNLDVSNTADIVWSGGGPDGFTGSDLTTLRQHGTYAAGTRFGIDTSMADGGTFTLDADLVGLDDVSFLKTGTGTLVLTGDNTSTGDTTVETGILVYANRGAFYDGVVSTETADRLTIGVNNGQTAIVSFGVGGADGFTTGEIAILAANANLDGNALLGLDTRNAVGGVFDYTHEGTANLAKTGSGTLRLTGTNTGTGTLRIAQGTLQVGGGGTVTLANDIIADATVLFDQGNDLNYAGSISGSGQLIKSGSSLLTLSGDFNFTGSTTINEGTLAFSDPVSIDSAITVDGDAAVLQASSVVSTMDDFNSYTVFSASAGSTHLTVRNGGTVTGGQFAFIGSDSETVALRVESGGTIETTGPFVLGANFDALTSAEITGTNSTVTVGNATAIGFVGFAELEVADGGTLSSPVVFLGLSGDGTLNIQDGGTVDAGSLLIGYDDFGYYSDSTGTINLHSGGTLRISSDAEDYEDVSINAGSATASLNLAGGTLKVNTNNFSTEISTTLATGTSSTVEVDTGLISEFATDISGSGTLIKTGPGTLSLTASNTYTGETIIQSGTLTLGADASLDSTTIMVGSSATFDVSAVTGGFTLASSQTLGGTGSIAGMATIGSGAILAPGNSPGTLTFTDGLTLDAGAILNFELGTVSDLIAVTGGTLTGPSSGTVTLNLSDSGGFTAGTYTLFDYTSATLSDFETTDFSLGTTIAGFDYSFNLTGTAFQLIAATSAVPEPSTYAAILGLGALGFVIYRKRHPWARK